MVKKQHLKWEMTMNSLFRKIKSPIISLILVTLIGFSNFDTIESFRLRLFDLIITEVPRDVEESQIVSVNIGDDTIARLGQFPFPRSEYSQIIETLYQSGAGLVVFNIAMTEPDRYSQDDMLSDFMLTNPVVLPYLVGKSDYTPDPIGVSMIGELDPNLVVPRFSGIIPNVEPIQSSAFGKGISVTMPELDGVVRRLPMVISVNGDLYPSIVLETLRVAVGDPSFQIKTNVSGVEAVRIPSFATIFTDPLSRVWIDWKQPVESIDFEEVTAGSLSGRIVIVGMTAGGITNPVASALGEVFPHHVQSMALSTAISGTNITRPDWVYSAEMGAMIFLILLSLFISRYFTHGYIFPLLVVLASPFGVVYIFQDKQILVDVLFPSLGLLLVVGHNYTIKFLTELKLKLQIKKQFGTYLSPALVEKLQKNPELLELGGETRDLSILFTDVRGFTAISEHYGEDVQGLTQIMNRYMTAMTEPILNNDGTLDKYIGDAQMAFWNAPLDQEDHAKRSVITAQEMLERLDRFNDEITAEGIPAFGMGIGINSGKVVVGNMGSDQRFDYTCLGDSVNLGARLEGQTKNYGVRLLFGENTAEKIRKTFRVMELDCIAVKGKTKGVKVYTLGNTTEAHHKLLKLYYAGEWEKALEVVDWCIKETDHHEEYYRIMEKKLRFGCPDNWDGVNRLTSK